MAKSKGSTSKPVQLDKRDGRRQVVITADKGDRFVRTCGWAVEACQVGLGAEAIMREFNDLLQYVGAWCVKHAGKVGACVAAPGDGQIGFLVSSAKDRYDFDLSDLLTDLDVALAQKFQIFACEVLQAPHVRVIQAAPSIPIHGVEDRSSHAVGA